jgi:hypothetical protein
MRVAGIFVSYSRESEAAVRALAQDVEALEHTVWYDHDLSGGKVWWEQILTEIRNCQVFMMAVSPDSLRSVACSSEYNYAAELGKPILPILIADGVSTNLLPPKLSQIQFIDYRKQDKAGAINLARALRSLPEGKPLPDPLPQPPAVPLSYLGRITEQIESAATLDHKEQSALVSELRRGLRDAETSADARKLLERLRKRDDLFARTGDEIDELLEEAAPQAPRAEPSRPEPKAEPRTEPPRAEPRARKPDYAPALHASDDAPAAARTAGAVSDKAGGQVSEGSRMMGALYGGGIGFGIGVVAAMMEGEEYGLALVPAIAGAIAGAIAKGRPQVIHYALIGAFLLGFAALMFGYSIDPYAQAFAIAAVLGIPPGAVIGAVVGALVGKIRA